jgi:MerR family transcriptional regulator, copper efflux regulator
MRISELATRTQLKAHTIRFYEKQGLLPASCVRRKENNYRDYNDAAVEHLLLVKEGQLAGFTVAELKELTNGDDCEAPAEGQAVFIRRKIAAINGKMDRIERFRAYLFRRLKLLEMTDVV